MLNSKSIKVLKALGNINYKYTPSFNSQFKSIAPETINATLLYLHECKYISCLTNEDNEVIAVMPEYKGQHYFEFRRAELKQFMLKSVLTPVIVSVITTFITLTISRYF